VRPTEVATPTAPTAPASAATSEQVASLR
jgi:hypothetical protein